MCCNYRSRDRPGIVSRFTPIRTYETKYFTFCFERKRN